MGNNFKTVKDKKLNSLMSILRHYKTPTTHREMAEQTLTQKIILTHVLKRVKPRKQLPLGCFQWIWRQEILS